MFPCLQQLVMDPSEHVRQALASVMNDMSPVLGNDNTINHLLPMLLTLLRDTNPDVRWDKTLFGACIFYFGMLAFSRFAFSSLLFWSLWFRACIPRLRMEIALRALHFRARGGVLWVCV